MRARVPLALHLVLHVALVLITGVPTSIILCLVGKIGWSHFLSVLLSTAIVGGIGGMIVGLCWRVVDHVREQRALPYNMSPFVDRMSGILIFLFLVLGVVVPLLQT